MITCVCTGICNICYNTGDRGTIVNKFMWYYDTMNIEIYTFVRGRGESIFILISVTQERDVISYTFLDNDHDPNLPGEQSIALC